MTDQLFDPGPPQPGLDYPAVPCGWQGDLDAWQVRGKTQRPRCNRPPGHEGPHRKYKRDGKVLAEWHDG